MQLVIDDTRPIFVQIAERIENDIIAGELPEDTQVPSTNQFAAFYQLNPATAAKGVNLLVDQGILYKKRGLGMYVAPGARETAGEAPRGVLRALYRDAAAGGGKAGHLDGTGDADAATKGQSVMTNVVEVSNLTKAYGGVTAVDHVSFSWSYALLPNATV